MVVPVIGRATGLDTLHQAMRGMEWATGTIQCTPVAGPSKTSGA